LEGAVKASTGAADPASSRSATVRAACFHEELIIVMMLVVLLGCRQAVSIGQGGAGLRRKNNENLIFGEKKKQQANKSEQRCIFLAFLCVCTGYLSRTMICGSVSTMDPVLEPKDFSKVQLRSPKLKVFTVTRKI
jgi:hypothetical protein